MRNYEGDRERLGIDICVEEIAGHALKFRVDGKEERKGSIGRYGMDKERGVSDRKGRRGKIKTEMNF